MTIPIYQVDAFTDAPFRGNPAGVCVLSAAAGERWMQAAAAEMNLAETAFLFPESDAWRLRWFTPRIEVDLCGHATLAAAHILWESGRLAADATAQFETKSGLLTAVRSAHEIALDFPAEPATAREDVEVARALDLPPDVIRWVGANRMDWLVEAADEATVRGLSPDFRRLAQIPTRGVIVTARSIDPKFDFVSRFFAPAAGIDEDPVTGSAHCCLAPYWAERLGRRELTGYQASSRGGVVRVMHEGSRVRLIGSAVTIFSGAWSAAATIAMNE